MTAGQQLAHRPSQMSTTPRDMTTHSDNYSPPTVLHARVHTKQHQHHPTRYDDPPRRLQLANNLPTIPACLNASKLFVYHIAAHREGQALIHIIIHGFEKGPGAQPY